MDYFEQLWDRLLSLALVNCIVHVNYTLSSSANWFTGENQV